MGGTPRGKDKPRPSYETGALRDPKIAGRQDDAYDEPALRSLIRRGLTRASDATGGTPANRA